MLQPPVAVERLAVMCGAVVAELRSAFADVNRAHETDGSARAASGRSADARGMRLRRRSRRPSTSCNFATGSGDGGRDERDQAM